MRAAVLLGLVGCGFSPRATAPASGDDAGGDAVVPGDAPAVDAWVARAFYADDGSGNLYSIDVDTHMAAMVAPIMRAGQTQTIDGLAYVDGVLYGIPSTDDVLLTIDPATALVTNAVTLSASNIYWGLTGAGATIYAATNGTSNNLYTIAPDGTVALVGSFGNNMGVAGDLAFVNGTLYAELVGGTCNPQCLAVVNTSTGAATPIKTNEPSDVWGLAGFRGTLWALRGNGDVDSVNTTNGNMTKLFTSSASWSEGD